MEKFIDRLQHFMESEGINDNQITVRAGLSVGLIGKCKRNGSGMASDSIEKILLAYPNLSADWLLTGRGNMRNEEKNEAKKEEHPHVPSFNVVGTATSVYVGSVEELATAIAKAMMGGK